LPETKFLKLYTVPLAPNPMRVTLYLAERAAFGTDIPIEAVVVNTVKGRHREPEHLARNPFGTLPVLELDSGTFITESLSIIDYFEAA
jgi:glutathione S-transferase